MQFNFQGLNNNRVVLYNKRLVLFFLYIHGSLSISELAKFCSLSIPAISRLVNELKEEHKVTIINQDKKSRGNSAGLVRLLESDEVILCMNVTSHSIDTMLCSGLFNPISEISHLEITLTTKEQLLYDLKTVIETYLDKGKLQKLKVAIGIHGQVDRLNGVSLVMPQAPWSDSLQIKYLLEQCLPVTVVLDNDCVMKVLAQKWHHLKEHQEIQDLCIINLDYGIGSAFLIGNEVYRGSLFGSGQIGHTIVEPNGKKCACGRYGCLETIASQYAIENQVNTFNVTKSAKAKLSFDEIVELYHQEHRTITTIVDFAALNIGRTIYNFLNIININHIYLYGSLCRFGPRFLQHILAPIELRPFDKQDQIKDFATVIDYGHLDDKQLLAGIAFLFAEQELTKGEFECSIP